MAKFIFATIVAVLAMTSMQIHAISPYFTSTFYNLENTIERFTYCRAYPIVGSTNNASGHLIQTLKSFLNVANFSVDSLENFKHFMGEISMRHGYEVETGLSDHIKYNMSKSGHCQLVEHLFDSVYPVLRQSAYNRSQTLNLTHLELPSPVAGGAKVHLSEFVNALWINADFTKEEMDTIGHAIIEYIKELQQSANTIAESTSASGGTKRAGGAAAADTCCSYADWLSYYIDSGLALLTRVRLGLSTRALESRMAISSGFSFTKNKLSSGFSRLVPSRGGVSPTSSTSSSSSVSMSDATVTSSSVVRNNVLEMSTMTPEQQPQYVVSRVTARR